MNAALFLLFACSRAPEATELVRASGRAELPASVTGARDGASWRLRFGWTGTATDVRVTGDFTGWSAAGLPMTEADGRWSTEVVLPPGIHRYKLVIDGAWLPDPANPRQEPDGFEGVNSVLRLGPDGLLDPAAARLGDARADADAVRVRFDAEGLVRVETLRGDVSTVAVRLDSGGEIPLTRRSTGALRDHWEGTVRLAAGEPLAVVLGDGGAPAVLAGFVAPDPLPVDDTPEWARNATWYAVFPDRFRNGDPANDPSGTVPWAARWEDGPDVFPAIWSRHLGGDLAGIEAGLGHIASLGVDAIYLNPVWDAPSPHRYDATSWDRVDPELGGDEALVRLIAAVHARGMRIVLDGVFNHVGETHPAAVDVRMRGAASPFAGWFEPGLVGWNGHAHLPVLAHDGTGFRDPSLEAAIFSATRRWMDPDGDGDPADGIDGWRLDVADEVPAAFWRRWRAEVASVNPEAVVIGEVWKDVPRWAGVFHGVTDYRFAPAIVRYAEGHSDGATVAAAVADLRAEAPVGANAASWTLVDSHDTDRLLSRMFNPGLPFDARNRTQDHPAYRGGRPSAEAFERARLTAFLQATLPGSPLILAGDEVGVWGADDPHNRRPMPWPDAGAPAADDPSWDAAHLAWYREVFGLRRKFPALSHGDLETVHAAGGLWIYRRGYAIAAVNASDLVVLLPEIGGTLQLGTGDGALAPRSVALWAPGYTGGPR